MSGEGETKRHAAGVSALGLGLAVLPLPVICHLAITFALDAGASPRGVSTTSAAKIPLHPPVRPVSRQPDRNAACTVAAYQA
jgi:hypothetical protein